MVQVPVWVWSLRTRSAENRGLMFQLKLSGRQRTHSASLCIFVLFRPSTDWMMSTYIGLSPLSCMLIYSLIWFMCMYSYYLSGNIYEPRYQDTSQSYRWLSSWAVCSTKYLTFLCLTFWKNEDLQRNILSYLWENHSIRLFLFAY